jgi:hypothetical protein
VSCPWPLVTCHSVVCLGAVAFQHLPEQQAVGLPPLRRLHQLPCFVVLPAANRELRQLVSVFNPQQTWLSSRVSSAMIMCAAAILQAMALRLPSAC